MVESSEVPTRAWVILDNRHGCCTVLGIFTSKELADRYAKRHQEKYAGWGVDLPDIDEIELDDFSNLEGELP